MSVVSVPMSENYDLSADGSSVTSLVGANADAKDTSPSADRRFVTYSTADGSELNTVNVTLPWAARPSMKLVGVSPDHQTWCVSVPEAEPGDSHFRLLLLAPATGAVTELPVTSADSDYGYLFGALRVASGMTANDNGASGVPLPSDVLYVTGAKLDDGNAVGLVSINLSTGKRTRSMETWLRPSPDPGAVIRIGSLGSHGLLRLFGRRFGPADEP